MKCVFYHCTQDPRTALRRDASPPTVMWVPGVKLRFSFVSKFLHVELSCWAPEGISIMLPGLFFFYLDHLHIKWPHSSPVPGPPSPGQVITLFHMNCHPQCDGWCGQACGHNCEGLSRLASVGIVLTMLVHEQTLTTGTVPGTGHLGVKVS